MLMLLLIIVTKEEIDDYDHEQEMLSPRLGARAAFAMRIAIRSAAPR
jgi:hypothetical protein